MRRLKSLLLLALILPVVSASAQPPQPGVQVAQTYRHPTQAGESIDYLLSLPPGYGVEKQSWPVLIFLHGSGERGSNLSLVKKHGPPKLVDSRALPFIVVSPQCPSGARWKDDAVLASLQGMLDEISRKFSADVERVYLTGLSLGGEGTWHWAWKEPYRFAAIAPICGRADPEWGRSLGHLPTWVFHGAKDTAVPLSQSEAIVEVLRASGNEPRFTVYPEAGHDSWTESYANDELYAWLLTFKKQPEPPKPLVAPKP